MFPREIKKKAFLVNLVDPPSMLTLCTSRAQPQEDVFGSQVKEGVVACDG